MAKRASQDEIIESFYGINCKTYEVERVSMTRGRRLSKWGKDGHLETHQVALGREPKLEVVIVFGLSDVLSVPEIANGADWTKKRIDELEIKAAEMKKAASASGGD